MTADNTKYDAIPSVSRPLVKNWAGTHACQPVMLYRPTTEEQIQTLVANARGANRRIRAVGARHSPGDLFFCDEGEYLVSMDGLNQTFNINEAKMSIVVGAGMRLLELDGILASKGLALAVHPDYQAGSIGGLISTGSHSYGVDIGNLSTQVLSLTILLADGRKVECSRSKEVELFMASCIGLGLTGIILRVELAYVPAFRLEVHTRVVEVDKFIGVLKKELSATPYVTAQWWPVAEEVIVSKASTSDRPLTRAPSGWRDLSRNDIFQYYLHELLLSIVHLLSVSLTVWYWRLIYFLCIRPPSDFRIVTDSVGAFTSDNRIKQRTYEGCVPLENASVCLRDLKDWLGEERKSGTGLRRNFGISMRIVAGDDIWLSPTFEKTGVYFGATELLPYGRDITYHEKLYSRFEAILRRHGARPHWGKMHSYSFDELKATYPNLEKFLRKRQEVDPAGMFVNHYARRHFDLQ